MKAKIKEKHVSRNLRQSGWSIPKIATKLGVSESSVSLWVRDIRLTDAQKKKLDERSRSGWREKWKKQWRDKRLCYQEYGRKLAKQNDRLHMAGCLLYWAEGAKSRNTVAFANSDVNMTQLFVKFLQKCYGVKKSEITININCYLDHGLSMGEIEKWWLNKLRLSSLSLRKGTVAKPRSKPRSHRKNKLKYGICTIRVNQTKIVQSIFGAIQEYGAFKDNKWLDC